MSVIYSDYSRDRIGWFFGLSGWQLAVVALSSIPTFWSVQQTAWASTAMFLAIWVLVALVTVVPVRGRSAVGWIAASVTFAARRTGRLVPVPSPGCQWQGRLPDRRRPARRLGGHRDPRRATGRHRRHPGGDHPEPRRQDVGHHRGNRAPRYRAARG